VQAAEALARFDVALVRAANPGPLTLAGTNTWLIGRDPAWAIDPGPALREHAEAVAQEARRRGGLGGIALTHEHADHAEGLESLRALTGEPPVADVADGERFGPLEAVATPGHAPDHVAFVSGAVCFTGDAVLGEGSVFIAPDPGALAGYLEALRGLRRRPLELLCPGHGPPVTDPATKLDEYVAHRLERERRLVAALGAGTRRVEDLLDAAWDDVPAALRGAAAVTLAAHLDKLEGEGRLPPGVQRPQLGRLGQ
jgi:glyoxylase-like metal-dependent hydrolase (beta-lactamase superfamily II)